MSATKELIEQLRSATEDDVAGAMLNASCGSELVGPSPACLLEFYNAMLDLMLGFEGCEEES